MRFVDSFCSEFQKERNEGLLTLAVYTSGWVFMNFFRNFYFLGSLVAIFSSMGFALLF